MKENPYDFLEVDPRLDSAQLTKELRRRIQRATPEEKARIQEAWESLTLLDEDRVRLALMAHPRPSNADPSSIDVLISRLPPVLPRLEKAQPRLNALDFKPSLKKLNILDLQPKLDFKQ